MASARPEDRGWSEAEFADLLSRPGAILTGDSRAFVLGQVVVDEAEIFMVATDPAHRRRGLARAALLAFEDIALERGATRVLLDVAEDNAPARALYADAGYSQIAERRGYYQRGKDVRVAALVLEKHL